MVLLVVISCFVLLKLLVVRVLRFGVISRFLFLCSEVMLCCMFCLVRMLIICVVRFISEDSELCFVSGVLILMVMIFCVFMLCVMLIGRLLMRLLLLRMWLLMFVGVNMLGMFMLECIVRVRFLFVSMILVLCFMLVVMVW